MQVTCWCRGDGWASYIGYRFIYHDQRNRPFRFKVEQEADKSCYKVPELLSWCFFGMLSNTEEGLRNLGLVASEQQLVFTELESGLIDPDDLGQEGEDILIASFAPAKIKLWAQTWLDKLQSASQEEQKQLLPHNYECCEQLLVDLNSLIQQAKYAEENLLLLDIHWSIDSVYTWNRFVDL